MEKKEATEIHVPLNQFIVQFEQVIQVILVFDGMMQDSRREGRALWPRVLMFVPVFPFPSCSGLLLPLSATDCVSRAWPSRPTTLSNLHKPWHLIQYLSAHPLNQCCCFFYFFAHPYLTLSPVRQIHSSPCLALDFCLLCYKSATVWVGRFSPVCLLTVQPSFIHFALVQFIHWHLLNVFPNAVLLSFWIFGY